MKAFIDLDLRKLTMEQINIFTNSTRMKNDEFMKKQMFKENITKKIRMKMDE